MRFIPIANARRVKVGQEVFTINADGKHGVGKLKSRVEDEKGVNVEFEVPQYAGEGDGKPKIVKDITHISVPVDRKEGEGSE